MTKVLVLLIFYKGNFGYVTVSGLPTVAACEAVYEQLRQRTITHDHKCIEYEVPDAARH